MHQPPNSTIPQPTRIPNLSKIGQREAELYWWFNKFYRFVFFQEGGSK